MSVDLRRCREGRRWLYKSGGDARGGEGWEVRGDFVKKVGNRQEGRTIEVKENQN